MSKDSIHLNKDLRNGSGFQRYLTPAVLLGLILLLGIALRLYDLGAESYNVDEIATIFEGQQSIHQLITSGRLDQPLGYYLPFHLWENIFGTAEVNTRFFSALAGIGSIVLIYLIGRELFGNAVGLISALLMAISGFQIYYSQEARYYSFFELMTLLSFLFFILALRSKRNIYFVLYGVTSILMVYSLFFGLFILAAQNLFLIMQWKKYRNVITTWLICQALVLLAIVPNFYLLIFGEGGLNGAISLNTTKMPVPSLWVPLRSVYRFVLPARGDRSWETILTNYAIAGAFFVVSIGIYAMMKGKSNWLASMRGWVTNLQVIPDSTGKFLLVSCWFVCPILLPFILSMVISPIYTDRYTISAAPALYLLLAFGIFSIRKVVPLMISLGVLLIMIVPSLNYNYTTDIKEQWREAAVYVDKNSRPDEVIVFVPNEGVGIQQRSFNWYYRGTLQDCGLSVKLINPGAISEALMKCVSGHNRFWVIIRGGTAEIINRFKSFFLNPNQTAMHLIKEQQFVEISVYLFELTKR
jgi:mannosyltransferase